MLFIIAVSILVKRDLDKIDSVFVTSKYSMSMSAPHIYSIKFRWCKQKSAFFPIMKILIHRSFLYEICKNLNHSILYPS